MAASRVTCGRASEPPPESSVQPVLQPRRQRAPLRTELAAGERGDLLGDSVAVLERGPALMQSGSTTQVRGQIERALPRLERAH